jgi:hemerythrin superfamily protein
MEFVETIKGEHAKATELIGRLADTSDGAMKTRERLVGQLRTLLDSHAMKEEAYLYPALQRRDDARDFLGGALQAHEEIGRLLRELDEAPKDDPGFQPRIEALRRVVERHAKEEEKLLPGLKRALSAAETQALDEGLSAPADEIMQMAAETGAALRHGTSTALEGAHRTMQEAGEQGERAGRSVLAAAEIYGDTAQLTAEDLQAIATCSTIAIGGMSEMRQAWVEWLNRTLRASARASQELLRCTTLEQVAGVQRAFFQESLENLLEGGAEMLRISGRISEDARRPIEDRVTRGQRGEERSRRAAAS